jgi:hypothetical protein
MAGDAAPSDETAAPRPPVAPVSVTLLGHGRLLIPGLYAWSLTVLYPSLSPGASLSAKLLALLALPFLFASPFFARDRPGISRLLGIYGFLGASAAAFVAVGPLLSAERLDPPRAALGSVGWVLYAFGWGRARTPGDPEDDPNVIAGAPLHPRGRLPVQSSLLLWFSIVAAVGFLALPFWVDRREHSVFAHAVSVVCALAVLGAAAEVALELPAPRELPSPSVRMNAIALPVAGIALLLALGLVWSALE